MTQQSSATVPAGNVISQNPRRTRVWRRLGGEPGGVDGSGVGDGAERGGPDAVGGDDRDHGCGLVLGTVTQQSSATVPAGNVISQNPSAGDSVAAGSAVNLVVSTGPASVSVPNVVGLTQSAATTAITDAGLVLGR